MQTVILIPNKIPCCLVCLMKIHTVEEPNHELPPVVPARGRVPSLSQNQAPALEGPSSPTAPPQPPHGNIQPGRNIDVRPSVVSNLKNLRKKFQKKRSKSQEHLYTEINAEAKYRNEYQTCNEALYPNDGPYVNVAHGALPREYHAPPPFAPGF